MNIYFVFNFRGSCQQRKLLNFPIYNIHNTCLIRDRSLSINQHKCTYTSLVPRPIPSSSMLHAEKRVTLKNWEWPGNEATHIIHLPDIVNSPTISLTSFPRAIEQLTVPLKPSSCIAMLNSEVKKGEEGLDLFPWPSTVTLELLHCTWSDWPGLKWSWLHAVQFNSQTCKPLPIDEHEHKTALSLLLTHTTSCWGNAVLK